MGKWEKRLLMTKFGCIIELLISKKCKESGIPLYFVRYEDLVVKPKETLEEMFAFVLGV